MNKMQLTLLPFISSIDRVAANLISFDAKNTNNTALTATLRAP
jgi:hypothetical protein